MLLEVALGFRVCEVDATVVGVNDTQLDCNEWLLLNSLSLHKQFLSLIPKGYAIVADFFLSAFGLHQQG